MSDFLNIADFLSPINKAELNFDTGYKEGTIGFRINVHDEENFPDIDEADLVFIGCGEQRGNGHHLAYSASPDAIRRQFYQLYFWHQDLRLADLGNLRKGADLADAGIDGATSGETYTRYDFTYDFTVPGSPEGSNFTDNLHSLYVKDTSTTALATNFSAFDVKIKQHMKADNGSGAVPLPTVAVADRT